MLKIPKKYTTVGVDFRIKHTKDMHPGGAFDFKSELIELNVDRKDDLEVLQTLIHEELEATLVGLGCRYTNTNSEFVFSFGHNAFSVACQEMAKGVYDLIQANRAKPK